MPPKTTRRGVIRSISGFASVLAFGPAVSSGASDTVKEPLIVGEGEVQQYVEVPRKWHEYTAKVKRVRDKIRNNHLDDRGVVSVHIARGKTTTGGMVDTVVEVDVVPDKYEDTIPDSVRGVEVRQSEARIGASAGLSGCHNKESYSSPPAGVVMSSDDTGDAGTTTWIFYPEDTTKKRMFSAAHVYHACDRGISTVINNDHMLQHGTKWGTPQDGDAEQDWIATKENHMLNSYDETVDDEDYGKLPMSGAVTNYDF